MRHFTKEWLKASSDDILIIKEIITNKHLTHMVAFHAQQSVEKTLKSLIEEYEIDIPKIHKLVKLNNILESKFEKLDKNILYKLDQLYIDSRYPGDMGLLPNGKPTLNEAEEFYNFALMVFDKSCSILKLDKNEFINND